MKTSHTASGQSNTVATNGIATYFADFTTGAGAGSAQLQMRLGGDWVPAAAAVTATMVTVAVAETRMPRAEYRWNVTVSSGTIITYLHSDFAG